MTDKTSNFNSKTDNLLTVVNYFIQNLTQNKLTKTHPYIFLLT